MLNINRPALTAAANCLRSIFRNTDKRHICITGSRGIGKTTLLEAAFPQIGTTLISRAHGKTDCGRAEFITLSCGDTGETVRIGEYRDGHMQAISEGFELGISAVQRYIDRRADVVMIDELGFLERSAPEYREALLRLFEQTRVIAAVRKGNSVFAETLTARADVLFIDLDEWYMRCEKTTLGCVLLASGFSTRFSSNKLLAEYRGKPLITYTMSALSRAAIGQTAVVTRYDEVRRLAEEHSFRSIMHDEPMLSDTIRLGVSSFEECVDGYMLCVADQPLLTAETLQTLSVAFALDLSRIIRPRCGDTPGNPVIFPASLKQDLMMLEGEQGGRAVIKTHPELLSYTEIADSKEFMDVDTAEALLQLQ